MSVRGTSREAYHSLSLGERQREVFRVLKEKEASNTELSRLLSLSVNQITPRVYELRKLGLVEDKGVRLCPVTGRRVHYWGIKEGQLGLF